MEKIYTITFHASYNFGSCLQAYALQEYIKDKFPNKYDYKIINLRTAIQKDLYKSIFNRSGIKNFIKKMIFYKDKKKILVKEKKFEDFINNKLNVTDEYSNLENLYNKFEEGSIFISGSDQLWNLRAIDFNWANFLEFAKGRKIAFSASCGYDKQQISDEEMKRIKEDLKDYQDISVRDIETQNVIEKITGNKPVITVDPTMLLDFSSWNSLVDSKRIVKEKYIFLYNLKGKKYIELAKKVSDLLSIPVVVANYSNKYEIINGFKIINTVGPIEFLNLIKNAELVLSSSFHGTIFAIMFHKSFFALNGANDFRINTLLNNLGVLDRSLTLEDYKEKCKRINDIDYDIIDKKVEALREEAYLYLKKNFDIEG